MALSSDAFETATFSGFFVPVAVFMIFAGIGFFFLWRVAWLIAMITQGASLFGCLSIYFTFASELSEAGYIYLIMLYCMILVLYLNTNDVRITFQAKQEVTNPLLTIERDEASDDASDEGTMNAQTNPNGEPNSLADADRALLRRFEPVLRFTRGEQFFPMDVEPYVRASSLWRQHPDEPPELLIAKGELGLERLGAPEADEFGVVQFLKAAEPLLLAEMAIYHEKTHNQLTALNIFQPTRGRLARVGYASRFIDAIFEISLLARGRVPGDLAAGAALIYQRMLEQQEAYTYQGRVLREHGWTMLQYWFFYSFDNWRSGFFGANDHEADWEMITLYLAESETTGEVTPAWIAYAAHDYAGDDLRRRWDDPELEIVGEHPVVYVGAGSHASYFSRGEYLTEIQLPFLAPLVQLADRVQRFGRERLRQYQGDDTQAEAQEFSNIFRVAFVDYARGDGLSIGPGQEKPWSTPRLLNPPPAWLNLYHGLWGLYAHDPLLGEDAPAGPMFNRNGSPRRSWYDPLGWAGLDKVVPPDEALDRVLVEQADLRERQAARQALVNEKVRDLQSLGTQATAMRDQPHLTKLYTAHEQQIEKLGEEVGTLRAQIATDQALLEALTLYAEQLRRGDQGSARIDIHRAMRPASAAKLRASRLAEIWAAASVGLMLILFVILLYFGRHYRFTGLVAMVALVTFIEASFRGRLIRLVTSVTIGLAIVATFVLLYQFFVKIVVATVLVGWRLHFMGKFA